MDPLLCQRTACGPATMSGTCLPAIPLTCYPLPTRPLGLNCRRPACSHPGTPGNPRSGPVQIKPRTTKVLRGTMGNTHLYSYENKQFPYAATSQHGPHDSHHEAWQSYATPGTAYTSPWPSYGYQSVGTAPT